MVASIAMLTAAMSAAPAKGIAADRFDPAAASGLSLSVSDDEPVQGEPLLVEVATPAPVDNIALVWEGTSWPLREAVPGRYEGMIGIDLLASARPATIAVEWTVGGRRVRVEKVLAVGSRRFAVQKLTLPENMAQFDAATLRRIREEAKVLEERFARITRPLLWRTPFLPPVEEYRPANFGARRVINGEPRMPHAGVDLRLPEGTPVRAIADGVVAFAGEQFFGGRSVVIDHGGGVFSIYYHLKENPVVEGQRVARGERIGAVGATGRATGPHLHFSVRVPGGRVDPSLLFALPGR